MTGAADSIDISDVVGNAITVSNIPLFTSPASTSVNENIGSNQVVYTATASDSSAVTFSLKADTVMLIISISRPLKVSLG